MIRPKNETECLILSITKNYETLTKQIQSKPQETLDFKLTKSRETFSFKPSINLGLKFKCVIGSTSLEVYLSNFNTTEENNKFELYTDVFDEFLFKKLKDEL